MLETSDVQLSAYRTHTLNLFKTIHGGSGKDGLTLFLRMPDKDTLQLAQFAAKQAKIYEMEKAHKEPRGKMQ